MSSDFVLLPLPEHFFFGSASNRVAEFLLAETLRLCPEGFTDSLLEFGNSENKYFSR